MGYNASFTSNVLPNFNLKNMIVAYLNGKMTQICQIFELKKFQITKIF